MENTQQKIVRFDLFERVVHWTVAISFVYVALSGLALWSPKLYWLAGLLGGGETIRAWHPWAGVAFSVALLLMFSRWASQMMLDADDRRWLMKSYKYAMHDEEGLPRAGRFNAGQKMMFWLQSICCLILLLSGLVLWFPESMSRGLRLTAILAHPLAALFSLGLIIIHLYMATIATPGSLRSMVHGWVTPGWAKTHHWKWFRKISDN